MTPIKVELSDVTYNAATQAFETRATLHDGHTRHSYACMIQAPITMDYEDAAGRLSRQAFRLHRAAGRMRPRLPARYAPHALSSTAPIEREAA